jgi:hypothetical protein
VTDLVERLQAAATAAIANERPSLEHAPALIRRLTIELEIANAGAVVNAMTRVERSAPSYRE